MDGILVILIFAITALLVYKMISSTRKQEGYKRWKATGGAETSTACVPKFDEEAVTWCAGLLRVEAGRLNEILGDF